MSDHARDAHPARGRPSLGPGPGAAHRRLRRASSHWGCCSWCCSPSRRSGPPADLDPEGTGPDGARALAEVLRQPGRRGRGGALDRRARGRPAGCRHHGLRRRPHQPRPGATARLADSARSAGRLVLVGVDERAAGAARVAGRGLRRRRRRARRRAATPRWPARTTSSRCGTAATSPTEDAAGARSCFVLPSDDGPPDQPDPDAAHGAVLVQLDATRAHPATVVAGLGPAWTNENDHPRQPRRHGGAGARLHAPAGLVPARHRRPPGPRARRPRRPGRPVGLAAVDRPGDRPAAGRRRAPRPRPRPPARSPRARAAAGGGARHRDHREPRTPLPPGRRPRPAPPPCCAPAPPSASPAGSPWAAAPGPRPSCTRSRSPPGARPARSADILFGPAPPDDVALIHLAQQLTDLEERVRHP